MSTVYMQLLLVISLTPSLCSSAGTPITLTDDDKSEIVDLHNKLRRQEGSSDMELVAWNDTLAQTSARKAAGCEWTHTYHGLSSGWNATRGQNLAATSENAKSIEGSIQGGWYNEKGNYNYNADPGKRCKEKTMCGHYTMMVWAPVRHVGCASYWCDSLTQQGKPFKNQKTWFFVCEYLPPGNIQDRNYNTMTPYAKGPACSQCGSGAGWCKDKLCTSACSPEGKGCCAAHCHNCAKLDEDTCRCSCVDGWTGSDCKMRCKNYNDLCDPAPGVKGWPRSWCDTRDDVRKGCPAMCGMCKEDPDAEPGKCEVEYGPGAHRDAGDGGGGGGGGGGAKTSAASTTFNAMQQQQQQLMMMMMMMLVSIVSNAAALLQ